MEPLLPTIITTLLVLYAYLRNALTPRGILAAIFTATAHAIHPWSTWFTLLCIFFLGGTGVTKVSDCSKRLQNRTSQHKILPRLQSLIQLDKRLRSHIG